MGLHGVVACLSRKRIRWVQFPYRPPQIMKLDFDQKYSEWLLELSNYDLDMFKYLRGYDFSLDRMKKAK